MARWLILLVPWLLLVASSAAAEPRRMRSQLLQAPGGLISPAALGQVRAGRGGVGAFLPARATEARELRVGRSQVGFDIVELGIREVPSALISGRSEVRGAHHHTDIIFVAQRHHFEQLWVLKSREAPSAFAWQLSFRSSSDALVSDEHGGFFFVSGGRRMLHIPAPFAVDASGVRHDAELHWNEAARILTTRFEHAQLPHPVVLDPPVNSVYEWLQRTPTTAPSPRLGHGMGWDPQTMRVVLVGGRACSTPGSCAVSDETWEWDGTQWALASQGDPGALRSFGLTSHSTSGQLVLHGGSDGTGAELEVWERSQGAWVERNLSSNIQRRGHALTHLPAFGNTDARLVTFGGVNLPMFGLENNSWTMADSADSWSNDSIGTVPSPRRDMVFAWEPGTDHAVLFGGRPCTLGTSCAPEGDTWHYVTGWEQQQPTTSPPARWGAAAAWDSVRQRYVLFGGRDGSTSLADQHEWDGAEWVEINLTDGPPARGYSAMAFDPVRETLVLFGGAGGNVEIDAETDPLGDTWEYVPVDLSCDTGGDCASGNCVDGVCCETASCGSCETCAGGTPGICAAVRDGTDADSCQGLCDADGVCQEDECTEDAQCGVCGVCVNSRCRATSQGTGFAECAPFNCDGSSTECPTACSIDLECVDELVCNAATGACVNRGAACSDDSECDEGFCTDGVCCDSRCDAACEQCGADGICAPRPSGDPGEPVCEVPCNGEEPTCPGKSLIGEACGASSACESALCIEGRCCSSDLDCGECSADGRERQFPDGSTDFCENGCERGRCVYESGLRSKAEPYEFELATPGGGCGCRVPTSRRGGGAAAVVSLMLLGLMMTRRRKRGWLLTGLLVVACAGRFDIESDEPCRNAGFAISSRIHSCTGDHDRSNERYERFAKNYLCTVAGTPQAADFACAAEINDYDCDTVESLGDDLDEWLARRSCSEILTRSDGTLLDAAASFDDPRCNDLAEPLAVRFAGCFDSSTALDELRAQLLPQLAEAYLCDPAVGSFEDCESALLQLDCDGLSQSEPLSIIEAAGDACSMLSAGGAQ